MVIRHLRDASERGIQIVLTTHSPWVLDEVSADGSALKDIVVVTRREGVSQYKTFDKLAEVRAFAESIPAGTRYTHLQNLFEEE
jgi:predicted ATPase